MATNGHSGDPPTCNHGNHEAHNGSNGVDSNGVHGPAASPSLLKEKTEKEKKEKERFSFSQETQTPSHGNHDNQHDHGAHNGSNGVDSNGVHEPLKKKEEEEKMEKKEELARFTFSQEPSFEEVRRLQAQFTDERDWRQFHRPRNLLLAMVGEVGEVSELFQWRGEAAEGLPDWTEPEREQLGQELSDVLIYLLELAAACHVDLPRAALRKMALNRLKYPASKVHGSAKKYTEYTD
ncbi:unnamed protein product [Merluccius merluccius]